MREWWDLPTESGARPFTRGVGCQREQGISPLLDQQPGGSVEGWATDDGGTGAFQSSSRAGQWFRSVCLWNEERGGKKKNNKTEINRQLPLGHSNIWRVEGRWRGRMATSSIISAKQSRIIVVFYKKYFKFLYPVRNYFSNIEHVGKHKHILKNMSVCVPLLESLFSHYSWNCWFCSLGIHDSFSSHLLSYFQISLILLDGIY